MLNLSVLWLDTHTSPVLILLSIFVVSEALRLHEVRPLGLLLLEKWCIKAFEDDNFRGRFKIMGKVPRGVPKVLASYNGKPTLVTGSGKVFRGENYIEVDCNVADWCYPARITLYSFWASCKEQRGSFGCTIESRENEYMPEKILGCLQFAQFDMDHAPEWPFAL